MGKHLEKETVTSSLQWYENARNPMRRIQRHLLVEACKGPQTLDIGGGTGRTAAAPAARGISVLVIDSDAERIAFGRRHAPVWFIRGNGYSLPFSDDSLDEIVMEEIIEHLQDQAAFVAEAHRVLRPGGRLVLSTPNRWPFRVYIFFLRLVTCRFSQLFTHVQSHTAELNRGELKALFAGFSGARIVGLNPFLPPPFRTWPALGFGLLGIFVK